jgi:hypothetical protein
MGSSQSPSRDPVPLNIYFVALPTPRYQTIFSVMVEHIGDADVGSNRIETRQQFDHNDAALVLSPAVQHEKCKIPGG